MPPAAGWYFDRAKPGVQRYYDGTAWTARTRTVNSLHAPIPEVGSPQTRSIRRKFPIWDTGPSATWSPRRWVITAATAFVVVVLMLVGIVTANVIQENARVAKVAAAAEKAAEFERARLERVHEQAVSAAWTARTDGERRYAESEAWGEPAMRALLRMAIDALAGSLASQDSSTDELDASIEDVRNSITRVGTEEEANARKVAEAAAAEAQKVAEAAAALDQQYLDLLAQQRGIPSRPDQADDGRRYCDELKKSYTPQNVADHFTGPYDRMMADPAAVHVYCPEFAPEMDWALSGVEDGDHVVGEDMAPGTYHTYRGANDCYWERNDGSGNIIDNNFITSAHNGVTVTVYTGEGFSSTHCGLWVSAR